MNLNDKNIEIFSSRDRIRSEIVNYAQHYLKLKDNNFSQTSYLSYLVDVISILTSNLVFYNSSLYRELFLTKCIQRDSVLNLSQMISYQAELAVPSQARVFVEIPLSTFNPNDIINIKLTGRSDLPTATKDVTNNIFKVYAGDVTFSLKSSYVININKGTPTVITQIVTEDSNGNLVSSGWKTVECRLSNSYLSFFVDVIQIEDVTNTYVIPPLLPFQFYELRFNFKKNAYLSDIGAFFISTQTNSIIEEWSRKGSVFLLGSNEKAFTFREIDNGAVLSFGNGIMGKQPETNSTVVITAGLCQGFKGNVITGSIKQADPVIVHSLSTATSGTNPAGIERNRSLSIKVINKEPALGGKNPPSVDEIRSNAIKSVSANKRLVSTVDYHNMNTIIPGIPVENVYDVIKRSDLKRNEITIFTDLIYNDSVVPTKNMKLSRSTFADNENVRKYKAGTIILEDLNDANSTEFSTLFDIEVYKNTKESKYLYVIDEIEVPAVLIRSRETNDTSNAHKDTNILPIYAKFYTDRTSDINGYDLLYVDFYANAFDAGNDYSCKMFFSTTSAEQSSELILTKAPTTNVEGKTKIFKFTNNLVIDSSGAIVADAFPIRVDLLKRGKATFNFRLEWVDDSSSSWFNDSKIELYITQDLSDFMYSQVTQEQTGTGEGPHSVDLNGDWVIDIRELTEFVNLYSMSTELYGGEYHIDNTTMTGYAAGPGNRIGLRHSADQDNDWEFELADVLRVISLYNRGGQYHEDPDTEDGYAPGAADVEGVGQLEYVVYDVPCIKKEYREKNLIARNELTLFTRFVMQKITDFDVYEYKMATDFVNLKFANTTGISTNMRLNPVTRDAVIDINPILDTVTFELPPPGRYAVSEDRHPWKIIYDSDPSHIPTKYNRRGGFIAYYDTCSLEWMFENMNVNDMFMVNNPYGQEIINGIDPAVKMIYSGEEIKVPTFSIPLEVEVTAFIGDDLTTTASAVRKSIENKLIDTFSPRFGYEKSIYISEITEAVLSVPGVKNVKVNKPDHDIFFDYDPFLVLTQAELLEFTPELIYFDAKNISINIVSL